MTLPKFMIIHIHASQVLFFKIRIIGDSSSENKGQIVVPLGRYEKKFNKLGL